MGTFFGVFIHWLFVDHMPKVKMTELAGQRQEEMNKMVRSCKLTDVKPEELTITVEKSGDPSVETGKEITLKVDAGTTIQEGTNMLNQQGQVVDATKYLKPGMKVDVLNNTAKP